MKAKAHAIYYLMILEKLGVVGIDSSALVFYYSRKLSYESINGWSVIRPYIPRISFNLVYPDLLTGSFAPVFKITK